MHINVKWIFPFIGVLLALVTTAPALADTAYYVAPGGSDSNPGTLSAPFATFGKAQNAMRNSSVKTTYLRAGTYNPSAVDASGDTAAIYLTAADSGETWAVYPADGVGSVIIDGGASSASSGINKGILVDGASNVTINGLQLQHFAQTFLRATGGASGVVFSNNIVHDNYASPNFGGIAISGTAQNNTVANNYIYNTVNHGILVKTCEGSCAGGINGTVIKNNYLRNTCTIMTDCGAIYLQDYATPRSTNVLIQNNFVRDVSTVGDGAGRGIYLDDGTSNITVTGNISVGAKNTCFNIHGGSNNVYTGNLCDLQSSGQQSIMRYETSDLGAMGPGNAFMHNVVIAGSTGGGGYAGDGTTQPMTISNNAYYNYVGSTISSNGNGGAGSDTNPMYINPQLSTWCYTLASGSPVYNSPVSFPGIIGGWGPTNFTIPSIGTAPSSSHASGCGGGGGDTQAPSVPANLTGSAVSSSQINLSWSASTDNVGVTGYKVYSGGTQIATVSGTTYTNTGLTAATTYTYAVAAYDAAGNTSAQSSSVSATTLPVTATPTATLTANPTSVTSGQSSILTWGSTNATSCTGVGFSTGGATSGAITVMPLQTAIYSVNCDGASASATVTVTSTTQPPTITLSANPASILSGGSSTLTWSSSNATSCTGNGFSTGSAISGSKVVTPAQTTMYSVTCTGAGGSALANTTVTVSTITPSFGFGAAVTATGGLNVRDKANLHSAVLCAVPAGTSGTIVGGPTVAQGYTWWNVNWNYTAGCDGWSVQDYLALGTTTPPPSTFTIGEHVKTTDNLNIRSKPGASKGSKILCTQLTGSTGSIVGGPQTANGYTWWNVTFDSGCSGWGAESYLAAVVAFNSNPQTQVASASAAMPDISSLLAQLQAILAQLAVLQATFR